MPESIGDAEQALDRVAKLAPALAAGASERDRDRRLPRAEIAALSESGLLTITVPRRFGGPGLGATVLARVVAALAAADGSIAQIPQSHFVFLEALARGGSPALGEEIFGRVLRGARIANAQTERGGTTVRDDATRLTRGPGGRLTLTGTKYYCTGAAFADILAVRAVADDGTTVIAYADATAPGITIDDDWAGFGQRTTSSGTVTFDGTPVADDHLVDYTALLATPSTYGARAQLVHAAIDTGIARGALDAAASVVTGARPWFEAYEAGATRAADDPLLLAQAGDLELAVRGAESLLGTAARRIDDAEAAPADDPAALAEASLATAAAKVAAGRAARRAGSELFDFGGTRTAAEGANLSRYWRDARTHTLHDPERWKLHHLGRWALARELPPSHGTL
ncbi:acyl-CoA dehydrogenase family protein [Gordonia sp. PP30]|uniref:acyl-CoA dehydrogenase family protein n=1 Tax=unclassified Gordonia (in: high G+C Gram-positive bacteria) TaxID=2657482 RepID=UPI001FFF1B5E|nr:acyl-CoA dehydrogenase family protein [Gordonia sp. PP30]UQE76693.1 acyl-CoA dehydrogenase family protein [Gordonia sp. PP30]